MKTTKNALWLIMLFLSATATLFVSCKKDGNEASAEKVSMLVKIGGKVETRASAEVTNAKENEIKSITVLVFNKASGELEKVKTVVENPGLIEELTPGDKKVVVVANAWGTVLASLEGVKNYTEVAAITMGLNSQSDENGAMVADKGLLMTAQAETTLKQEVNKLDVSVTRVVAKVVLKNLTLAPLPGYDIAKFQLKSVHIMNVREKALLGLPSALAKDGFAYVHGTKPSADAGGVDVGRLSDQAQASEDNKKYFYVTPNDNTANKCTLMTIEGVYDSKPAFFVFKVNAPEADGSLKGGGDGKYIEPNHVYTINVKLKKLTGSDNPDTPTDPTSLEVTVTAQDWVYVAEQNVEW